MEARKEEERAGISAQTSVGEVATTTGGHSESTCCVASGHTSAVKGAVHSGCSVTAKATLQRRGATVHEDSDLESGESVCTQEEEALLRSPGDAKGACSASKKRPRAKPSKEGLKAKAIYKAAVKVHERLSCKSNRTKEEEERLAWAKEKMEEGRAYYAARPRFTATDPGFANRIEEGIAAKRQRSAESETARPAKKSRRRDDAAKPNVRLDLERPTTSRAAAMASEVARRHLIVALIDRSNPLGQISQEHWGAVEHKLLDALVAKMDGDPTTTMPTFDGAGWLNGVKIIKCKDDPSLLWVKEAVATLQGLWEGAVLEVVDRSCIPSIPKAKVLIPRTVKPENALRLLQRQNPDVPTGDWRVLKVTNSCKEDGSQNYILQINKPAEDILYARFGKMAWGIGSVYLRLKKRSLADNNANTLEEREVEKDLGEILEATLKLQETEKGDPEILPDPEKNPDPCSEGSSNKSA
ncbi:uncharacterized protein LOC118746037 [Rhagoletis pomonella]|uniref:uncharacterized protein LOC118746037 n=1 Tax=Rhagoletis pomonella TaxID=28610 RepID=UPI0017824AA0|nr:uncharacterized protein LOC118746037 [Rhagoletis pomonella]